MAVGATTSAADSSNLDAGGTSPSVFKYGLQPYKAVHDVVPKVRKAPRFGFD
jgi:hypothetical protein